MEKINNKLEQVAELIAQPKKIEKLTTDSIWAGVDLGTASIVLVVVDENENPVFAGFEEADVVRDGLVVNYSEAVRIVKRLKSQAEELLGTEIKWAAGAIPPGTVGNNKNVVGNVIESAGLEVVSIVDEPTAAALALEVDLGAVVDVGGGTTGISIFEDGKVVYSGDEPTGGTQMTLVLSGALKVPVSEGEMIKRDPSLQRENFPIIKPVVEKMVSITKKFLEEYDKSLETIYLVGGATAFEEFPKVFRQGLNLEVIHPNYPQFVTPLGIALEARKEAMS